MGKMGLAPPDTREGKEIVMLFGGVRLLSSGIQPGRAPAAEQRKIMIEWRMAQLIEPGVAATLCSEKRLYMILRTGRA